MNEMGLLSLRVESSVVQIEKSRKPRERQNYYQYPSLARLRLPQDINQDRNRKSCQKVVYIYVLHEYTYEFLDFTTLFFNSKSAPQKTRGSGGISLLALPFPRNF